eukprot:TRINITY_DN8301_c0_g1_i1.p1 TRINITY_DN8301_c0_g1~~TRINITY_DN8301_c0_g1_i1.p1  ORF type:complete len:182 (+),score=27.63 TRINITY_DN8301_c0_g1_i1:106-651(+)
MTTSLLKGTESSFRIQEKNTFIHVQEMADLDNQESALPRCSSAPSLLLTQMDHRTKCDTDQEDLSTMFTQSSEDGQASETSSLEEKMRIHTLGQCKPCGYFYFKEDGCRLGDLCQFCHFCSDDDVKDRKRSMKRQARSRKRVHQAKMAQAAAEVGVKAIDQSRFCFAGYNQEGSGSMGFWP